MKVYIIVLHFGDIAITQKCIQSLFTHETYPFSLIVVNNTGEKIHKNAFTSKKITLITNKKNLGFAAGMNVGIADALSTKADAVCLLNNDTVIKKPFLSTLVETLDEKQTGIVGPSLHFLKNKKPLFDIGGKVNTLFLRTSHHEIKKITDTKPRSVVYISGCCMLIKKQVFKEVGFLDERFFLYYEDADFCLRAAQKGYQTKIVSSVVIDHSLSKSAGKMSPLAIYHLLRSAIIFGQKYAVSPVQKISNRIFILFQAALFLKANPSSASAIARALSMEE